MQVIYTLASSVISGILLFYLMNYALTPYLSDKMLSIKNLIIVSVFFVLTVGLFFSVFHQIIDKLFFRKFYEKPKIVLSLRRGILLGILLVSIAWIKIFGFFEWHIILLIVVLIVLFEALFVSIGRSRSSNQKKKSEGREEKD